MLPNTSRSSGRDSARQMTVSVTVLMPSTQYSCAALWRAFCSSCRPIYWLAITAPPVASAETIWMIKMFRLSTSDTLDTAASPTPETISVSAIPMVTLKICSRNSGQIRVTSLRRSNRGAWVCMAISFLLRYIIK